MRLMVDGPLLIDRGVFRDRLDGTVLLTDSSVLFLQSTKSEQVKSAARFWGIFGLLAANAAANMKARKAPPTHLDDVEIIALDDKVKKRLLTTDLVKKL